MVALTLSPSGRATPRVLEVGSFECRFFGPSNYWECILEKIPGVQNDYVAAQVAQSCVAEFPNTGPVPDKDKVGGLFSVPHARECVLKYGKDTATRATRPEKAGSRQCNFLDQIWYRSKNRSKYLDIFLYLKISDVPI